METFNQAQIDERNAQANKALLGAAGLGVAGSVLAVEAANATATPVPGVDDISNTVSGLSGLATAALAVVLVPFGIFYAVKIVRRVMSAS